MYIVFFNEKIQLGRLDHDLSLRDNVGEVKA